MSAPKYLQPAKIYSTTIRHMYCVFTLNIGYATRNTGSCRFDVEWMIDGWFFLYTTVGFFRTIYVSIR